MFLKDCDALLPSLIIHYGAVVDYPGALPGLAVGYEQQQDPKGFWEEVKDEYHYCKRSIERNFQKLNRKTR